MKFSTVPRCAGNVLEQEEITDAYFLTVYMQSCTDYSRS